MVKRTAKKVAAKKPVAKKTCKKAVAKKPAAKKTATTKKLYVVDKQGNVYGHI